MLLPPSLLNPSGDRMYLVPSNPVLTHRHLGKDYPVQSLGHADLVQTPTGDWYAVFLGKRIVEGGLVPLGRETFLCEVSFQNGEPIFNPSIGVIGNRLKRPPLPWTPVSKTDKQNDFKSSALLPEWAFSCWESVFCARCSAYTLQNGWDGCSCGVHVR